jgi:hypothetical protein
MQFAELYTKDGARFQQRLDNCSNDRMIGYQFPDTLIESSCSDHTDLEPEVPQRAPQIVLNVVDLPLEKFARGQQEASMLARRCLNVNGLEEPGTHHLGYPTGIVPIGLVDARGKSGVHMAGLDTDRWQAGLHETGIDPLGQWSSFEANALKRAIKCPQPLGN